MIDPTHLRNDVLSYVVIRFRSANHAFVFLFLDVIDAIFHGTAGRLETKANLTTDGEVYFDIKYPWRHEFPLALNRKTGFFVFLQRLLECRWNACIDK